MSDLVLTACGTTNPVELLLRGGAVRRYHTESANLSQNVAEHTWRMMIIIKYLWPQCSRELLEAALYHDAAEGLVGDVPAPVKRDPDLRAAISRLEDQFFLKAGIISEEALSPEDYARLKVADYLELCVTCYGTSGRDAHRILKKGREYVLEHADKLSLEEQSSILILMQELTDG